MKAYGGELDGVVHIRCWGFGEAGEKSDAAGGTGLERNAAVVTRSPLALRALKSSQPMGLEASPFV